MFMRFHFPAGSRLRGKIAQKGVEQAVRTDLWGTAHRVSPAVAGRVNRFDFEVPGSKLQSDGSYTLDLSAERDARSIAFQTPDDLVGAVQVSPRIQKDGWAGGDYYMLETDATGGVVVEPGRNHRKVYVTKGSNGYTKARIAAEAGIAEAAVTSAWLIANPAWGATEATPLMADLGFALWAALGNANSNWLLLERGHDYANSGMQRPKEGQRGESPLHPQLYSAWGKGTLPSGVECVTTNYHYSHAVFRELAELKMGALAGWNWLLADIDNSQTISVSAGTLGFDGMTLYRTMVHDARMSVPPNGTKWGARDGHSVASFMNNVHGLLLWQSIYDYNGWQEGYDPDLTWNNGQFGQPPNALSQNIYIQYTCRDVGSFENVSARAASCGQQLRPGGYSVDNLFIDNNVMCNDLGGDYKYRGPIGEWSLHLGIVAISAAHRQAIGSGAASWGLDLKNPAHLSAIDNIISHRANPDDPGEIAFKKTKAFAVHFHPRYGAGFDNTVAYRWNDSDLNTDGLDQQAMDQATVQRYAAQKLGKPDASIKDYMLHVRSLQPAARKTELDALRIYLRAPYASKFVETKPGPRTVKADCTFLPDPRGEGFRWDNRINWSSDDLPGTVATDTVQLFGNRVRFARMTSKVARVTFAGGLLEVSSGKLTAAAHADAARVHVYNCGQYVAPAGTGDYTVRGGRLAFAGTSTVGIAVSGDAECLLGANLTVPAGKALRIDGGQCFAGWDGTGTAKLTLKGTLDLRSTPIIAVHRDQITPRYRQGWALQGEQSGFTGILDCLQYNGSTSSTAWHVAVRDLAGQPVPGEAIAQPPGAGAGGDDIDDDDTIPVVVTAPAPVNLPRAAVLVGATLPQLRPFRSGRYGVAAPTVKPAVVLAGALHLDLAGLSAGTFPLIEGASVTGQFTKVTVTRIPADLDARVVVTAGGVSLTLTAGSGQLLV